MKGEAGIGQTKKLSLRDGEVINEDDVVALRE
jgi:hypothetical protein